MTEKPKLVIAGIFRFFGTYLAFSHRGRNKFLKMSQFNLGCGNNRHHCQLETSWRPTWENFPKLFSLSFIFLGLIIEDKTQRGRRGGGGGRGRYLHDRWCCMSQGKKVLTATSNRGGSPFSQNMLFFSWFHILQYMLVLHTHKGRRMTNCGWQRPERSWKDRHDTFKN